MILQLFYNFTLLITMGGPHDLFKRMNAELKKSVDMTLAKANRSTQFNIGQSIGSK